MNRRTRTLPKSASWLINLGACEGRRLNQGPVAIYLLAGVLSAFTLSAPASALAQGGWGNPNLPAAACDQWWQRGPMLVQQSNDAGFTLDFAPLRRDKYGLIPRPPFAGMAYGKAAGTGTGTVEGAIDGSNIEFTINWKKKDSSRVVGVYTGKIGPYGRVTGTTYDTDHPESPATWESEVYCPREFVTQEKPLVPGNLPTGPNIGRFEGTCERARDARKRGFPNAQLEGFCAWFPDVPQKIVKVDGRQDDVSFSRKVHAPDPTPRNGDLDEPTTQILGTDDGVAGVTTRLRISPDEVTSPSVYGGREGFSLTDGWALAGRVAVKVCGDRKLPAGHFNGHSDKTGDLFLLCSVGGVVWRDASAQEIALTPWAFTGVDQVNWAQANRAAEQLCARANQGFAGGHFNGHQVDGKYGLFCYSEGAQWFDASDAELAATGFGFATPRLDDVPWAQAMRAATNFCVGKGFDGGFMNGHQAPNKYGVVCQK